MIRLPWLSRSHRSLATFADSVRGELAEMRTPDAEDRLLERILASRDAGARMILPVGGPPRRRRTLLYASAIAAAAAAVVLATELTVERARFPQREGDSRDSRDSWFTSELAFAQSPRTPLAPAYPPAHVSRAGRLHPMTLIYHRTLRDSTGASSAWDVHVQLDRDSLTGAPAWRLVAWTAPPGEHTIDSVWVSAATLAPLRRVAVQSPYRSFERITLRQQLAGLQLTGEMHAFRKGALAAHRTFDRALRPGFAPYLADAFAPLYHMGVAIDRNWTGSVSLLGWAVRDDDVFIPVNMRVDGEERVRVPAGEFQCWRLALDVAGRRHWYWIRKSDGLGIRSLDSSDASRGVRDVVLTAERRR